MSETDPSALVEFHQVSYSIPSLPAPIIDGLNLRIEQGETLVLLGESGCGKTTTLRLVNRLLLPTTGEVTVGGKKTTEWDPIRLRRQTGYVIQEGGLFPHFSVAQNISLIPRLEGWDSPRINSRVQELLTLVGLDPERFADRYPNELSGGQRQRVGVARALAGEPPLLLMDEPFGALDPLTRADLQHEFAALTKRLAKTVLFVTHDVREALLLGTRIGLMYRGRVLLVKRPQDFLASQERHVRSYLDTLEIPALSESAEGV
jgi:osmoprotectant transport system ATP-binding protein